MSTKQHAGTKLRLEAGSPTDQFGVPINSALLATATEPAPLVARVITYSAGRVSKEEEPDASVSRRTRTHPSFVYHLIRSTRNVVFPIGPLQDQVRWWLRHHAERPSETWVLQPSLLGPVWRHERWADRHKEIFAVAILEPR